jgi:BASS family bile acid:Na+ symporter
MTLAAIVLLTVKISLVLLVFTIGLGTAPRELTHLVRHPKKLVSSIVAMNLVMLAVAVAIVLLFPLHPAVKVVLVAVALSPVPPLLPKRLIMAGGTHNYIMALLFSASVFALFWIPFAGSLLNRLFPGEAVIPAGPVAKLVFLTVLGPTIAGVVVRLLAPKAAERIAGPLSKVATVLLICAAGLMLPKAGPMMIAQLGDGTLLALVAFTALGLLVGHLLGGPAPGDRTVLALCTGCRHFALALAIAQFAFPAEKAVTAAILLYLFTNIAVSVPYIIWRRKAQGHAAPVGATSAH